MLFKNKEVKVITFDEDSYPGSVWTKNEGWKTTFSKYHNVLLVEEETIDDYFLEHDYWLLDDTFDDVITTGKRLDNPPIHQDILQEILNKSWAVEQVLWCDICDSHFPDGDEDPSCGHLIWIDEAYEWGGIGGELTHEDVKLKLFQFLKELKIKGSINLLHDLAECLPEKYHSEDVLYKIWESDEHGDFRTLTHFEGNEDVDIKHCVAWIKTLSAKGWKTNPKAMFLRNMTVNWIYEWLVKQS